MHIASHSAHLDSPTDGTEAYAEAHAEAYAVDSGVVVAERAAWPYSVPEQGGLTVFEACHGSTIDYAHSVAGSAAWPYSVPGPSGLTVFEA